MKRSHATPVMQTCPKKAARGDCKTGCLYVRSGAAVSGVDNRPAG